jgi:hypothetical protein
MGKGEEGVGELHQVQAAGQQRFPPKDLAIGMGFGVNRIRGRLRGPRYWCPHDRFIRGCLSWLAISL